MLELPSEQLIVHGKMCKVHVGVDYHSRTVEASALNEVLVINGFACLWWNMRQIILNSPEMMTINGIYVIYRQKFYNCIMWKHCSHYIIFVLQFSVSVFIKFRLIHIIYNFKSNYNLFWIWDFRLSRGLMLLSAFQFTKFRLYK